MYRIDKRRDRLKPLQERVCAKKKKARRSCEPPDFYREWVSKHNPYTILKRIFPAQNFSLKFFTSCGENVDSAGMSGPAISNR
jgi:hypothetical protein